MIDPLKESYFQRHAVAADQNGLDMWILGRRLNELIAAVDRLENAPKPSGLRPLHIEDGQVKEAPVAHVPCGSWSALGWPIPSVPEAEPQEQEEQLPSFSLALKDFECALRACVVAEGDYSVAILANSYLLLEDRRKILIAAAHREYAQPVSFTQVDVDLLKAMPDSGDWQHAEGYGGINDGAWFRSLIERLQTCVSAAQPGKGV